MNEMIYYPSFEIHDTNWLKFALLYFDRLMPIIPYTIRPEKYYLSTTALKVMDESDLIRPYRPDYEEGMCASVIACEEFENYLRKPERYSSFFSISRHDQVNERWHSFEHQDCTLFEGKYSKAFFDFCVKNGIATPCKDGIHISSDLAFVYMSILADVISRRNGLEMITDKKRYSTLLLRNNQTISRKLTQELRIAENTIELALPADIAEIPIDAIIDLRNRPDFNKTRKAYIGSIKKLIAHRENQRSHYSLDELLSYKRDFVSICESSFNMIATVTVSAFSFWGLAQGQSDYLIPATANAMVNAKTVKDSFSDSIKYALEIQQKHLARKYLARLNRLNNTNWR